MGKVDGYGLFHLVCLFTWKICVGVDIMLITGDKRLCKLCLRCGRRFRPTGRFVRLCNSCRKKSHQETIEKWKKQ